MHPHRPLKLTIATTGSRSTICLAVVAALLPVILTSGVAAAAPLSAPGVAASSQDRLITVTGYAWCLSKLGIAIPAPTVCDSVSLRTSNGHYDTTTPKKGPIGPLDSGRFTFTGVPVPGPLDQSEITYTVTTEMGSGLTDGKAVRCVHEGTIKGIFFQGTQLDLFWTGGPWTAAPFSQCETPA